MKNIEKVDITNMFIFIMFWNETSSEMFTLQSV